MSLAGDGTAFVLSIERSDGSVGAYRVDRRDPFNWWAGNSPRVGRTGWELVGNPVHTLHVVGHLNGPEDSDIQDVYWPLTSVRCWQLEDLADRAVQPEETQQ